MTTKTHALLLLLCYATCIVIFTNSPRLISLLHGASDEKNALDQQKSVQTKFLALTKQNDIPWAWDDTETADSVLASYQEIAYQDHRAIILRDAGANAALFALILLLIPKLTSHSYSAGQRLFFFILALPFYLYITPGLVGQIIVGQIPFEIILLNTWGVAKGLSYIGYCSVQSFLIGLGSDPYTLISLIHDTKVVVTSGLLVLLTLGMP